jgi:hypothetical protein
MPRHYHEHLRKLWIDAGYPSNMGSAAVVPPPPKEYRRVYHFTSAEYAISNLVFNRLKVARFSELNDPFELLSLTSASSNVRKLIKDYKDQLNQTTVILCFCGDWTDPVIWSHYGANHRGHLPRI